MSGRKASLVVVARRFTKPLVTDDPATAMEEGLVKLGKDLVGHGLAVLVTIPGSYLDPESIPLALLVAPDGKKVCEGGVSLRTASCCATRLGQNEELHEGLVDVVNRWVAVNRDRWWLEDGSNGDAWREVAFLRGYHAITHVERRVELARRRDRLAEQGKLEHQRELDRVLGNADCGGPHVNGRCGALDPSVKS